MGWKFCLYKGICKNWHRSNLTLTKKQWWPRKNSNNEIIIKKTSYTFYKQLFYTNNYIRLARSKKRSLSNFKQTNRKPFLKKYALKNAPMLPMSRIGPASQIYVTCLNRIESLNNLMKIKLTIFSSQKTRPRHYKIAHNGVR